MLHIMTKDKTTGPYEDWDEVNRVLTAFPLPQIQYDVVTSEELAIALQLEKL